MTGTSAVEMETMRLLLHSALQQAVAGDPALHGTTCNPPLRRRWLKAGLIPGPRRAR
jgi:hypothetical protein